jgi:hypothetical protein
MLLFVLSYSNQSANLRSGYGVKIEVILENV